MERFFLPFKLNRLLNSLFISNAFVSFHYALVIYINSSYLSKFFNETQVSSLYSIGSIINVIILLNVSKILERVGNYKLTFYTLILECLAIVGLIVAHTQKF